MQVSLHTLGRLGALIILLFVTACTSTTTTNNVSSGSTGGSSTDTVAQAEEDPLICETVIPAGTRVGRRVCIRKSEKDRIRDNAQTITAENQRRAVLGSPVGN